MITIKFLGKPVHLELVDHKYENGRRAIEARDAMTLEHFGMVTVNIPEADLETDEACIKVWSENSYWVPQILSALKDRFVPTGREVHTGYVSAPVYRLTG